MELLKNLCVCNLEEREARQRISKSLYYIRTRFFTAFKMTNYQTFSTVS